MLFKLGNVCHILDLPRDFYPMDMSDNFLQIGAADQTIKVEDQTQAGISLVRTGAVSLGSLHPVKV